MLLHMRFWAAVQASQLIFSSCMLVSLDTQRVNGPQQRVVEASFKMDASRMT